MVHVKRHIAKAISWRAVGTVDTIILAGLISGNWKVGAAIGGAEVLTKMLLYFLHERFWYKFVKFGVINDRQSSNEPD